jgi:YD repeat-containing protein
VKEGKGEMKERDGQPTGLTYIPEGYRRRTNIMVVRRWQKKMIKV